MNDETLLHQLQPSRPRLGGVDGVAVGGGGLHDGRSGVGEGGLRKYRLIDPAEKVVHL